MADLDREFAVRGPVCGAHALGVIDRERHGLFLVDVFAGLDGVDEVLAMEVLRGGDEDGVDALVVEQAAVIEIGGGAGDELLGVFEAAGVDVGEGDEIDIGAAQRPAGDLRAAVANADDARANAVVRAENAFGIGERGGEAGCHGPEKLAA